MQFQESLDLASYLPVAQAKRLGYSRARRPTDVAAFNEFFDDAVLIECSAPHVIGVRLNGGCPVGGGFALASGRNPRRQRGDRDGLRSLVRRMADQQSFGSQLSDDRHSLPSQPPPRARLEVENSGRSAWNSHRRCRLDRRLFVSAFHLLGLP